MASETCGKITVEELLFFRIDRLGFKGGCSVGILNLFSSKTILASLMMGVVAAFWSTLVAVLFLFLNF